MAPASGIKQDGVQFAEADAAEDEAFAKSANRAFKLGNSTCERT